jgi:hypothetical protein
MNAVSAFAILAAVYCLVVAPIAVALAPPDRRSQKTRSHAARRSAKARIRASEGAGRQDDTDD